MKTALENSRMKHEKKKHKKGQKTSDPNENCSKFASKPSENKKFVRNEHRKERKIGGN